MKTLMSGTIASVAISKRLEKVVLGLKNITITGEPDPFFGGGTIIEEGMVSPVKNLPVVLSSRCCSLCFHIFTRQNCDDPYLVSHNGGKQILCVSCYMDSVNKNSGCDNPDVTNHGKHPYH